MFTTPTAVVGLKAIVITVDLPRFTFALALTVSSVDTGLAADVADGLGVGVTDGVVVPPTCTTFVTEGAAVPLRFVAATFALMNLPESAAVTT